MISKTKVFALATALRLILIVYGEWQDRNFVVKYTDIDYEVFTDAASAIVTDSNLASFGIHGSETNLNPEGKGSLGSPYERRTYRYTPLLAWALLPNVLLPSMIGRIWGKALFASCDLAVGYLLNEILERTESSTSVYSSWWLLNPFVAIISTRGNAESILALLVVGSLHLLLSGQDTWCAIVFGLAVHFKIYPAMYALPFFLFYKRKTMANGGEGQWMLTQVSVKLYVNRHSMKFAIISFSVFMLLNVLAYEWWVYGDAFINEAFLFHLGRRDHRHNFSAYWYHLYLSYANTSPTNLLAFLPQLLVVGALGVRYQSDPAFAAFMQTIAFVAFNKVCTSQYFMWYICLVPLVLPKVRLERYGLKSFLLLASWVAPQVLWLHFAYRLEHLGVADSMVPMWLSSQMFLVANCWVIVEFAKAHQSANRSQKND
ncbi:glycosyltransferase family 50 protein [Gonapodya prolifera JEL478]|uniref:GPI mannosyltransferase 1 n=1 Tax=Gonapodya prolifera (strain JEL478) TaxID=1344416 RepID=A0A139AY23_GONPJ|nr:glycosyltransferase family 50 protein [Gonapodya prolifera JEL478]|eukprot:KXS21651.1 glycosyltransferase family 50 protein [Gonapodya prolifera JEL478]